MVVAPELVAAGYIKSIETRTRCLSKPQTRSAPFPNMEPHPQMPRDASQGPWLRKQAGTSTFTMRVHDVQHRLAGVQD